MPLGQWQHKVIGIKRFQTSLANFCKKSNETTSNALMLVLSSLIGGAQFASTASSHRLMQRHHWSPATRPGNWYWGKGVMRSLPRWRLNCKNSSFTTAQTRWLPTSSALVLQQPSLKNPVRGSKEQGTKGCPRTFKATSLRIHHSLMGVGRGSM